jgi:hypothetical protein
VCSVSVLTVISLISLRESRSIEAVPLYAARIEDLGPGDFVKIDCAGCGHTALLAPAFLSGLGLGARHRVLNLQEHVGVVVDDPPHLMLFSSERILGTARHRPRKEPRRRRETLYADHSRPNCIS